MHRRLRRLRRCYEARYLADWDLAIRCGMGILPMWPDPSPMWHGHLAHVWRLLRTHGQDARATFHTNPRARCPCHIPYEPTGKMPVPPPGRQLIVLNRIPENSRSANEADQVGPPLARLVQTTGRLHKTRENRDPTHHFCPFGRPFQMPAAGTWVCSVSTPTTRVSLVAAWPSAARTPALVARSPGLRLYRSGLGLVFRLEPEQIAAPRLRRDASASVSLGLDQRTAGKGVRRVGTAGDKGLPLGWCRDAHPERAHAVTQHPCREGPAGQFYLLTGRWPLGKSLLSGGLPLRYPGRPYMEEAFCGRARAPTILISASAGAGIS